MVLLQGPPTSRRGPRQHPHCSKVAGNAPRINNTNVRIGFVYTPLFNLINKFNRRRSDDSHKQYYYGFCFCKSNSCYRVYGIRMSEFISCGMVCGNCRRRNLQNDQYSVCVFHCVVMYAMRVLTLLIFICEQAVPLRDIWRTRMCNASP